MAKTKGLYKFTRLARDVEVLSTMDGKKIIRRVKNKVVGRVLARIGFWKWLWG